VHKRQKQNGLRWKKYRDTVQTCRDGLWKAQAHMVLNVARDLKGNKKDFYRHVIGKRMTKEDVGLLMNGNGDPS